MTEDGRETGGRGPARIGGDETHEEDRRGPFRDVEEGDGESELLPVRAQDVRRPRVSGALRADVASGRHPHEKDCERDRSEEVTDDHEHHRRNVHALTPRGPPWNVHSRIGVCTAPSGSRRLSKRTQERASHVGNGQDSTSR